MFSFLARRSSVVRQSALMLLSAAVVASAVACSSSPTAPSAAALNTSSIAADATAKTAPAPTPFNGTWTQSPVVVIQQPLGTTNAWVVLNLTQKGSTITGEARRFVNTWDVNGNVGLVNFDLGSPGRVTGTATANAMSIVVRDFLETKLTLSMSFAISADGRTLTATSGTPNAVGLTTLVR